MKNTKKQSNKTFPNIGNVSSRSITNIRIPKEKKKWSLALKQILFNLLKNKNEMIASEYSEFFIAIKMLNRSVMV